MRLLLLSVTIAIPLSMAYLVNNCRAFSTSKVNRQNQGLVASLRVFRIFIDQLLVFNYNFTFLSLKKVSKRETEKEILKFFVFRHFFDNFPTLVKAHRRDQI